MPGRTATALLVLIVAASSCGSAMAQQEVIDNVILLGDLETLYVPGVRRVEERPEEKTPPETFEGTIEDDPFHRPLTTRFHPGESYRLEENGTRLRLRRGEASRLRRDQSGGTPAPVPTELPSPPAPLPGPSDATSRRQGAPPLGPRDFDDPGPPGGLTLESAIVQLLRGNQDLRTKYHEIPQAEADILTAGLRSNPIIFWDAGGTPYGRFSNQPGSRSYPLLITYRLDFTGRRVARVRLAQAAKRVLDARYQEEVRRKIDELDTIFVDLLEARQAAREARRSAAEAADPARRDRRAPGRKPVVERTLNSMALRNAEERNRVLKHDLAAMLDIPAAEADGIEPYGTLRVATPAPPIEVLLHIALSCRPDLVAQRLSIDRAHALERMEYSRRVRDTHILYQPWDYVIGQTNQGERAANTWGIALFAPLPLFDRNQGNIQRARIEISKMQSAYVEVERRVADDVRAAFGEFHATLQDQQELEDQVLPVVRQETDETAHPGSGDDAAQASRQEYETAMRAYREVVLRHRRSITRLNTAVGQRVVPCSPSEQQLSGGPKPIMVRQAVQATESRSR